MTLIAPGFRGLCASQEGTNLEVKKIAWCAALWLCVAFTVTAQESDAPQVLSTDLAIRQVVESDQLTVTFVIVDEDTITKITIDGEPQSFAPGDTVMITKEFTFTPGRRVIKVEVEDEAGNKRERSYLVAFRVPLEPEKPKEKAAGLRVNFIVEAAFEVDDNPTQDLSLPVTVSQIGEIEGVVDDSEQEDTRQIVKGVVSLSGDKWSTYLGIASTTYSDSDNQNLESDVVFIGGNWNPGQGNGFQLGATWTDVDLGGEDYVTLLTLSPATQSTSNDSEGTHRSLWGLDVTSKTFDLPDRKDDTLFTLKWVRNSVDKENQDSSRKVLAVGTSSEGTPATEFNFIGWDADWKNRWDSGLRWDIGWAYAYRDYPNDEDIITDDLFGDTRVDNVFRFSTGVGWEFTPQISALFNYRYVFDLSNDSPYVRQVYGLNVKGVF